MMMRGEILQQFYRFLGVGLLSTLVNYAVFYFLLKVGLAYQVSAAIGFCVGLVCGYSLNTRWTYSVTGRIPRSVLGAYVGVYLTSLCVGIAVIHLLVELFSLSPTVANVFAICVTTVTNFIGTKFVVFRR